MQRGEKRVGGGNRQGSERNETNVLQMERKCIPAHVGVCEWWCVSGFPLGRQCIYFHK